MTLIEVLRALPPIRQRIEPGISHPHDQGNSHEDQEDRLDGHRVGAGGNLSRAGGAQFNFVPSQIHELPMNRSTCASEVFHLVITEVLIGEEWIDARWARAQQTSKRCWRWAPTIRGNGYRTRRHAELSKAIHPFANRIDIESRPPAEGLS